MRPKRSVGYAAARLAGLLARAVKVHETKL